MVSSYMSVKKAVEPRVPVEWVGVSFMVSQTTLPVRDGRVVHMFSSADFPAAHRAARMGSPLATPDLDESVDVDVAPSENLPWLCIVWDDPVNLMSYVTYVFQTVLGYDKKRATELMMQVHTEGKAVVSSGEKDKVETDVKKLHTAGLWATMQQAG